MNRHKKKFLFFSLMILMTFFVSSCGENNYAKEDILTRLESEPTIVWGVKNDTKLFGLMNVGTNKVEGFDIDIAKAITKEILGGKGRAEFVEVTSKTRIQLLKNGNIDAIIATMTITDDRKKIVDFSDVYFDAGQSLLVKKGSSIKSVKDLKAQTTVLVVKGSTSAVNIRKAAPDAKILELENYSEAFTALKSGQGDAMTTDNAILLGMAEEDPDYTLVGGNFTDEPYGIAINKGQKPFLTKVNEALKTLKSNGTYDSLYKKWFPSETTTTKED